MDIMQPPLEQQAAPAAWRLARYRLDLPRLAQAVLRDQPTASADEITARLAAGGVSVSGTWVAAWLATQPRRVAKRQCLEQPTSKAHFQIPQTARKQVMTYVRRSVTNTDAAMGALNRVFRHSYYSFACYLQFAAPWVRPRDTALWKVIQQIALDHEDLAVRAARLLMDRRRELESGQYPQQFTASNYLSLEHLACELIVHQHSLLRELRHCLADLSHDCAAADLVHTAIAAQQRRLMELESAIGFARDSSTNIPTAMTDAEFDAPLSLPQTSKAGLPGMATEPYTAA